MTSAFENNLRIRRRETQLDIFKRYFNYLADKTRNYDTAIEGRIKFDREAEFGNDLAKARFDELPEISQTGGFYENFIWSYGGLSPEGAPENVNNTQRLLWQGDTMVDFVDPDVEQRTYQAADKDLLAVNYSQPSRTYINYAYPIPASNIFRFGKELEQFVQDHESNTRLLLLRRPDQQDPEIIEPLNEFLATIETDGPRNQLYIELFLEQLYYNTPGFGDQRQDSDMFYKGFEFSPTQKRIYREQLTGQAGFNKFANLLMNNPIIEVADDNPRFLDRQEAINYTGNDFTLGEMSIIEGQSLYYLPDRPPIRRVQVLPRSAPLAQAVPSRANKLQTLSEIVYALLGSSGEGTEDPLWVNYNMFKEQIRKAFGFISSERVYQALRVMALTEQLIILPELQEDRTGRRVLDLAGDIFAPQESRSAATVEYYNFRPFMKPILDYRSYRVLTDSFNLTDSEVMEGTKGYATIEPHYNFYLEDYERAISNPAVPENILPNMYIYSFITDRDSNFAEQPTWNSPEAAAEIQGNFDKLITLGEFEAVSLPSIMSQDDNFLSYLQRYSEAVKVRMEDFQDDSGVVIDLVSDLARQNYHITTPATEMNIYDRLNGRKSSFPMSIETSFPMAPTQLIGSLIDDTLTSTSFVNSVITTRAEYEEFDAMCVGLESFERQDSRGGDGDVLDDYFQQRFNLDLGNEALASDVYRRMGCRVFDFEEWMMGAQEEIEAQVQGEQGRERFTGQCPDLMDAITFESIRNSIMSEAARRMLSYEEILLEDKDLSQSETIIYKLRKQRVRPDGRREEVQNFYFPNSKKNELVRFVDTQVKYNTKYIYSLYGIEIVYGSKFEMRVLNSNTVLEPNVPNGRNQIYSIVNIKSTPNPKIIEYTLYGSPWDTSGDALGVPGFATNIVGGLFYPPVNVLDRPPPPPQMLLSPLRNNYQQLLLSFQPSNESFVGDRAIPSIFFEPDDFAVTTLPAILHQKQFKNFALEDPKIEFSSEGSGEIKRIEIYRSEEVPTGSPDERYFYRETFTGKLHKILDISGHPDVPLNERAIAFDCLDNIEVNKKYYYTARAVDVHGNSSNPGPVFEAEIVFQKGTYYPYINLYQPKIVKKSRPTRKMSRFLEIKAAPIQSGVKYVQNPNNETVSSQRGFVDDNSYRVENNKFLVRLTSRDTGRKIQFNISFKRDKTDEET